MDELNKLSTVGANDLDENNMSQSSIGTSIVASAMYCSPAIEASLTVSAFSLAVTSAWSCIGNQCR